ncbi:MAG TPA: glycosyltransferase [Nitrospira sp.]|nr:glycosyltransferase [Nitrospira sp.]
MHNKVPTLLIYATGMPRWERIVVDTLVGGLRFTNGLKWLANTVPPDWHQNRYVRSLLSDAYSVLSYVQDWQEAFCQSPPLAIATCNLNNFLELRREFKRIRRYELIVILHSAAGDSLGTLLRSTNRLQNRRGQIVVFFGNEYNLMPEKIRFANEVGAEFIASQLPPRAAAWLYAECMASRVLHAPPALNPTLYRPGSGPRSVDIGFRGDAYRFSLGDMERTSLITLFKERGQQLGLTTDIEFVRYHRSKWTAFLNRSRGIVGAESGTYYLERDDRTQLAVQEYLDRVPNACFEDIFNRFFKGYQNPVSGKAISSRHFEPIGTKTCQVLLEGGYNGILNADEHYIAVKKDFSNLGDAVARFKDESYRHQMVERTYRYVLDQHTYRHRVDAILKAMHIS